MGGAVSSGKDNNEFTDNLIVGTHIRTAQVEQVFRAVDRALYMTPQSRLQAYRDTAWKYGHIHLSAPCIYSEVLEGLELRKSLSFLNIGSGTGYLNTMVGLILGASGVNHGIEIQNSLIDYANVHLRKFIDNCAGLDEMDFCEPKFFCGNGLSMSGMQEVYDRIYCGAECPQEYHNHFQQLLKVGGILVMPFKEKLLQIKKVSADRLKEKILLQVSFVELVTPGPFNTPGPPCPPGLPQLPTFTIDVCPSRLSSLARSAVRSRLRTGLLGARPDLHPPPHRPPPAKMPTRHIRIPIFGGGNDLAGLDALQEIDELGPEEGGREMNALLRIVLSMGNFRGDMQEELTSSEDEQERSPQHYRDVMRNFQRNLIAQGRQLMEDEMSVETIEAIDIIDEDMTPESEDDTVSPSSDSDSDEPFPRYSQGEGSRHSETDVPTTSRDKKQSKTNNEKKSSRNKTEETQPTNGKSEGQSNKIKISKPKRRNSAPESREVRPKNDDLETDRAQAETSQPQSGSREPGTSHKGAENRSKAEDSDEDVSIRKKMRKRPIDDVTDNSSDVGRNQDSGERENSRVKLDRSGGSSSDDDSSAAEDRASAPRARKRRYCKPADTRETNRQEFSSLMKNMIWELPIPITLRRYINYHRSFDPALDTITSQDNNTSQDNMLAEPRQQSLDTTTVDTPTRDINSGPI